MAPVASSALWPRPRLQSALQPLISEELVCLSGSCMSEVVYEDRFHVSGGCWTH